MAEIKDPQKYWNMNAIKEKLEQFLAKDTRFSFSQFQVLEGTQQENQGDILIDGKIAVEHISETGGLQRKGYINYAERRGLVRKFFLDSREKFYSQREHFQACVWGSTSPNADYHYFKVNHKNLVDSLVRLVNDGVNLGGNSRWYNYELRAYGLDKVFDVIHVDLDLETCEWNEVSAYSVDNSADAVIKEILELIPYKEIKLKANRHRYPVWWLLIETTLGDWKETDWSDCTLLPIVSEFDHILIMYDSRRGIRFLK